MRADAAHLRRVNQELLATVAEFRATIERQQAHSDRLDPIEIAERRGQDVARPGRRSEALLAQDSIVLEERAAGVRGRGIEGEDPHSNHFRIASLRNA